MSQEWVEWCLVQKDMGGGEGAWRDEWASQILERLKGELNSTHQALSEDRPGPGSGKSQPFTFPWADPGLCCFNLALNKVHYKANQWEWNHFKSALPFLK